MNNQRRLIVIVVGVVIFIGLVVITAISLSPKNNNQPILVSYTDSITGEVRDVQPAAFTDTKHGELVAPEPNLVSVTGIQSFYDSLGNIDISSAINDQIVAFVRANAGPDISINEASIVDAKVTKTGSNPTTYTFEMSLKHPEGLYNGTIVMADNDLVTPTVKITKEQQ